MKSQQNTRSRAQRWALAAGIALLVGSGTLALFGREWLWKEIQRQAAERGVELSSCSLGLGLHELVLSHCQFKSLASSSSGAGRGGGLGLPGVQVSGSFERAEIQLQGFTPSRLRVLGAAVSAVGRPGLADLMGTSNRTESLPIEVERSRADWFPEANPTPLVSLMELSYSSDNRRLRARVDSGSRVTGQVEILAGALELTLRESATPRVRLSVHPEGDAELLRIELGLHQFPVRELEGSWLVLTETLRAIELDGTVRVALPYGLTAEPAAGNVQLTLRGLSFPVPREVEGLVYGSPPQVSGTFQVNRALTSAQFSELNFATGSLFMRGAATLRLEREALAFQASFRGPLGCGALAESALLAHVNTPLGRWAAKASRKALSGSVQIVAAVSGRTPRLDQAQVLTSIEPGCGLAPLPIPPELRSVIEEWSNAVLPHLPDLRLGQPARGNAAGREIRLPPLPALPQLPKIRLEPLLPKHIDAERRPPSDSRAQESHDDRGTDK